MPNWCEGILKIRGPKKNIKRVILEGINKYDYSSLEPVVVPKDTWLYMDDEFETCTINVEGYPAPYVEGTKRGFIGGYVNIGLNETVVYFDGVSTDDIHIVCLPYRQAWYANAENFVDISKNYNLDFRFWGAERGMGFWQEFEVINGHITVDKCNDYKSYDDYIWECPYPILGG